MLRDRISARETRALTVGGAAIAALLLLGKGLPALRHVTREQIARSREMAEELARARQAVTRQPIVTAKVRQIQTELQRFSTWLLPGDTPAASAGALVALVSSAAEHAGAHLGMIRPEPASSTSTAYHRPRVRAQASGDLETIAAFLSAIEEGPERLVVRQFDLSVAAVPGAGEVEVLRLELVIEGIARAAAPSASARRSQ